MQNVFDIRHQPFDSVKIDLNNPDASQKPNFDTNRIILPLYITV